MNLITIVTTAVVVISIAVAIICLVLGLAFGETEQQCVKISTNNLKMIGTHTIGGSVGTFDLDGCDWLVQKLNQNGSGFHIDKWWIGASNYKSWQYFMLVKN